MGVRVFIGGDRGFEWLGSKRLYGPTFDWREFHLAIYIQSGRDLPDVHYLVVDALSATVFAVGETKAEALEFARRVITCAPRKGFLDILLGQERTIASWQKEADDRYQKSKAESDALIAELGEKPVTKKRILVFDRHGGKCFYCGLVLELRSAWHIEHRVPRSKGGTDLPDNLVPACPPCNLAKGSMTDDEYRQALIEQSSTGGKIKAVK